MSAAYDPFAAGRLGAGVRTLAARDEARGLTFPCELWYPAASGPGGAEARDAAARTGRWPLVLFSHSSGQDRRSATYLATHLASHGYVVAAIDHSERIAPALQRREGESDEQRAARARAWIASRVPDLRFLLDFLLGAGIDDPAIALDAARVGVVGHSFGGWTALAALDVEPRIGAVVALAPGGSSRPVAGMLNAPLAFAWKRPAPTLYLVAENDTMTPLDGMLELLARTPAPARMVVLRRADHLHFVDDVAGQHEAMRAWTPPSRELEWLPRAMRPIGELASGEQAHTFVRSLALAHLDAVLRGRGEAERFLAGDLAAALRARGVDAFEQHA